MKAIICKNAKKNDRKSTETVALIQKKLHEYGVEAVLCDEVNADCDLIITIGGDGTILHHGKNAAKLGLPLLGINTGRLGFMTTLEVNELAQLELLREKKWEISSRMMLDIELGGKTFLALNDAVFLKSINSKLPEFKVCAGDKTISELRADGLILSTPTGSTAYALSAGGPIIEPWLDCTLLTPMCAHSLFSRHMILSAENPLTVQFDGNSEQCRVFVSVDGEQALEFKPGEIATIRKSALRLSLINLGGRNIYDSISKKLMKPIK